MVKGSLRQWGFWVESMAASPQYSRIAKSSPEDWQTDVARVQFVGDRGFKGPYILGKGSRQLGCEVDPSMAVCAVYSPPLSR